jgi:hypothetical protein
MAVPCRSMAMPRAGVAVPAESNVREVTQPADRHRG